MKELLKAQYEYNDVTQSASTDLQILFGLLLAILTIQTVPSSFKKGFVVFYLFLQRIPPLKRGTMVGYIMQK